MCDTRDGTSADFLHTGAHQNKSGAVPRGKRDYADNRLDKLPIETCKPLKLTDLSQPAWAGGDMLKDVNKRA